MKRWNVDRVAVFLFVVVLSFLYDLAFYLGIRDTARFPHPFVYFRSLGDIEYLRGFPWMLRQVMFSLVAGGLLGWAIGFRHSKKRLAITGDDSLLASWALVSFYRYFRGPGYILDWHCSRDPLYYLPLLRSFFFARHQR